jgi:hypothetical protein
MWNMRAKVIPVITGATGTTLKSLRQYLSNIQRKHEIKELQTTAILGTAPVAYRRGGWGVQPPPPRNSEVLQSRTGLQIERKMFSVPIPTS